MNNKSRESLALGMNKSTANHRLVKDVLFDFVIKAGHKCYRCGGDLARDDFSIEHKTPWLTSEDPAVAFFDIANITFSHLTCNCKAATKVKSSMTVEQQKEAKRLAKVKWRGSKTPAELKAIRREQYLRTGS